MLGWCQVLQYKCAETKTIVYLYRTFVLLERRPPYKALCLLQKVLRHTGVPMYSCLFCTVQIPGASLASVEVALTVF